MKKLFSHRKGLKELPKLQKEEWDKVTQNKVWDVIRSFIDTGSTNSEVRSFVTISFLSISSELLQRPNDEFDKVYDSDFESCFVLNDVCRKYKEFFFGLSYNEKFDFIELFIDGEEELSDKVTKFFNDVFKERLVGYRIVNGQITDIDNEDEYKSVEQAARETFHIEKAVTLLYDRKSHDYENSVKESISAVEQICKQISVQPDATLSSCISKVESETKLHPRFIEAIKKLYSYSSDEDGIRHGAFKDMRVSFEDAKFMLVICSAFCNYLLEKKIK